MPRIKIEDLKTEAADLSKEEMDRVLGGRWVTSRIFAGYHTRVIRTPIYRTVSRWVPDPPRWGGYRRRGGW